MTEKALNDFLASVAPYLKLWGSLRTSGTAVSIGGTWFNLAVRLEFIEGPPAKKERHKPDPDFLYYVVDFPIDGAESLIRELVLRGRLELRDAQAADAFAQVVMKREPNNASGAPPTAVQWAGPRRQEAGLAGDRNGRKRTRIILDGFGQFNTDLMVYDIERRVETRLRTATPCYDGLSGLYAHILPGVNHIERSNTLLEIVAELPFEMRKGDRGSAVIEGPAETPETALSLRCFYGPATGLVPSVMALELSAAERGADHRLRWKIELAWPDGSEDARAILIFEGEQVQALEVKRWPSAANLRRIVDEYFDPSQNRLKEALLNSRAMSQQEFEWAVARLLNLLGLAVVWYGKGAEEAKPDLAGYIDGGPVLLGECTLEKPQAKFSGLGERAKRLQTKVGAGTDVLALVFTRAETVDSEKRQAREYGLGVVGQLEIQELLKMYMSGASANDALKYLQGLRSDLELQFRESFETPWTSPW